MAVEKLLEEVGKEIIKENLSPNEKLLKENIMPDDIKKSVKLVADIESIIKISELDAAKNYFASVGDTEKLKALESSDVAKRAEALMEANEKKVTEMLEKYTDANVEINEKFNQRKDVSFAGYDTQRRRKCYDSKSPTYG